VLEMVRRDGRSRICRKTGKYRDRTSQRGLPHGRDHCALRFARDARKGERACWRNEAKGDLANEANAMLAGLRLEFVMRGQKRGEDARKRACDPRIHLLRKKFLRRAMDYTATRACPSCAPLSAASRVNPTCGVKPGNDGGRSEAEAAPCRHPSKYNRQMHEMADARSSRFSACSFQGRVQLQRVCSLRGHIFLHGDLVE